MQFIKDSIRELRHVVWPTREDTIKYFIVVVLTLVLFWLYLFVFSTIFSETLIFLKDMVNPSNSNIIELNPTVIETTTWTVSTWTTSWN